MSGSIINEKPAFNPLPGQTTLHDDLVDPAKAQNKHSTPSTSGVAQTLTPRKNLTFRESLNNSVIQHLDSYIVLGGDRPGHIGTGEGASGLVSDSIDLVCGRGKNLNDGKGLPAGYIVGPMFTSDAARIYISSSTHIDKNFGIAKVFRDSQPESNKQPLSGIGIKADRVRLVARDNIKIVTGMADGFTGQGGKENNSLGGKVGQAGTISLIGGNYTASQVQSMGIFNPGGSIQSIPYLQPAIKGDFLTACLEDLFSYVDMIDSAVFNICLSSMESEVEQATSTIIEVGKVSPLLKSAMEYGIHGAEQLYTARTLALSFRQRYLQQGGSKHIRSANVYLT